MPQTSDGLKWTEAFGRAFAAIVIGWAIVLVTGWHPVPCVVGSVVFSVGTAFASRRRWAMVRRWSHAELGTPWKCLDAHCLNCCDCRPCWRDRSRATELGVEPITFRREPGPSRWWQRAWRA